MFEKPDKESSIISLTYIDGGGFDAQVNVSTFSVVLQRAEAAKKN